MMESIPKPNKHERVNQYLGGAQVQNVIAFHRIYTLAYKNDVHHSNISMISLVSLRIIYFRIILFLYNLQYSINVRLVSIDLLMAWFFRSDHVYMRSCVYDPSIHLMADNSLVVWFPDCIPIRKRHVPPRGPHCKKFRTEMQQAK